MNLYDKGNYIAAIQKQELSQSKNKGTPQIVFTIAPMAYLDESTPEREEIQPNANGERRIYLYVTENTAERVGDTLRFLGLEGDKISVLDSRHPQHQDLTGREVEVFCQHETYQGQEREKWGFATGGGELDPIDPSKAKEIDNLMGKVLRTKPQPERAPAKARQNGAQEPDPGLDPAPAATAASSDTNDDLPF